MVKLLLINKDVNKYVLRKKFYLRDYLKTINKWEGQGEELKNNIKKIFNIECLDLIKFNIILIEELDKRGSEGNFEWII